MSVFSKIVNLSRQLLATGRAWRMSVGSNMERLFRALAKRETQAHKDAVSILYSLLPDNDQFTDADATDWERRLGMINGSLNPLATRKLAILRKMAAPGVNPAKGHYLWIQKQLRDAGFDVYVYENIFPVYPNGYMTMNPADLNPLIFTQIQQGDWQQDDFQQGGYVNAIVANSLINAIDVHFVTGDNLRATFFIGGIPLGTYASVPSVRETEFRQLILQQKQVQNVAILYITYT